MRTPAIIAALLAGVATASCGRPPVKATDVAVANAEATVVAPMPPARPNRDVMAPAYTKEQMDAAEKARRSYAWHDNEGVMRYGEANSGVVFFTILCQGDSMELAYQLIGDGTYPNAHPIRITAPRAGTPHPVIAKTYQNEVMGGYDAQATIPSDGAIAKAIYAGSAITITDKDGPFTWIPLPPIRAKALEGACAAGRTETPKTVPAP